MSRFGGGKADAVKTPADSWSKARVAAALLLTDFDPFFLVFVVPGLLLALAASGRAATGPR